MQGVSIRESPGARLPPKLSLPNRMHFVRNYQT
jgi:hypothetical protein